MKANLAVRGGGILRFVLLLVCTVVFVAASAGPQSQAGFLWVGESEGLLNLATDSGDVRFEISHPLGLAGVAVNDVNGDVWAYRKPELHAYSREGKLLTKAEAPPSIHGSDPSDMVVDGFSGNLWIAIKRDLYRFDMQGNLQQTLVMPNEIVALSLDRTRSLLWVAQRSEMRVYDADGQLTIRRELSGTPKGSSQYIYDLAYDRRNDEVWVARSDRLQRYNAAGEVTFESLGAFDGAITVDGAGGVWLARVRVLSHVNDAGSTDLQLEPFSGLPDKEIMDLVADPGDASVWIASRKKLRHYAIDGEMLHDIEPTMGDGVIRTLHRAALYADLDPPEIQITAPASGALLNHNRPTFELKYFDLGVGVNSDTIAFRSAGRLIAMSCQPGPSKAACVPLTPLPEGEVQIEATVADLVGNISEPAEVRLTIDTIPPEITVTFPPAGHITNGSALTLRGEVSEPATLSINGASVGMDAQNRFVHDALLQEGDNTFEFSAKDRAGNQSIHLLHVALDTVPPAIPNTGLIAVGESQGGQVTVKGASGSVEPGSTVRVVNARTGKTVSVIAAADGSFSASIEAEPGDELSIVSADRALNESASVLTKVPQALALKITEPSDGIAVSLNSIFVAGDLRGPLNTAVMVNGQFATVLSDPSSIRFYAHVPLQKGENVLTVTANLQDGGTLTKTLKINRIDAPYAVKVEPASGLLPHTARFYVTGDFGFHDRVEIDFNGDSKTDYSAGGALTNGKSYTYNAPGIFRPGVKIFRYNFSSGRYELRQQETLAVAVFDPLQLKQHTDRVLRSIWTGMNVALLAGDIPKALTAISAGSREKYAQAFAALQPHIGDVLANFSDIRPVEISQSIADYSVLRARDGQTKIYLINFAQDLDGVWRIDSM